MQVLRSLVDEVQERPVDAVRVGARFSAVVAGRCGLSSTLSHVCAGVAPRPVPDPASFASTSLRQLAQWVFDDDTLRASVGLAAVNASLPEPAGAHLDDNAANPIAKAASGRRVVVVGDFPFVERLRPVAREVSVFDLAHEDRAGVSPRAAMAEACARAEVAAISGTTLVNHTFHDVMSMLPDACFKVLLGPSTPLSALLFDYGLDALSGVVVTDVERVLRDVSASVSFREMGGVRKVTWYRDRQLPPP